MHLLCSHSRNDVPPVPQRNVSIAAERGAVRPSIWYSLIQMKCQGGNKYALSITVKFDQSTRKFGRISFARLFKLTKHVALLLYLLSPYLLSCMIGSRNVRKNMHIINTIMKFCANWSTVWDSNSVSQVCAALQRPIISKCHHSTKYIYSGTRYTCTCKVFGYIRNSLLSRKVKHLANIET